MSITMASEIKSIIEDYDNRKKELAEKEQFIQMKERQIRLKRQENSLRSEMYEVSLLTKRKRTDGVSRESIADGSITQSLVTSGYGAGIMKPSQENVDQIVKLSNELKHLTKRRKDIQNESKLIESQLEKTDDGIVTWSNKLSDIQSALGIIDGYGTGKSVGSCKNIRESLKIDIASCHQRQKDIQQTTYDLTAHIDDLTKQIEYQRQLASTLAHMHVEKSKFQNHLNEIHEDIAQLKRIGIRKEKLINEKSNGRSDEKLVKDFETDKRLLINKITKLKNSLKTSENAILTQDIKIRTLEGRLSAIAFFLDKKEILKKHDVNTSCESAEENALAIQNDHALSIHEFTQLFNTVKGKRTQLLDQTNKLDEMDQCIEKLEKSHTILVNASNSRAVIIAQKHNSLQRENEMIDEKVAIIYEEYKKEKERMEKEHERLKKAFRRIQAEIS